MSRKSTARKRIKVERIKKTVYFTPGELIFLERRVTELKRISAPEEADSITISNIVAGLVSFWMALDAGEIQHKQ